jgi:putative membrane protein
MVDEVVKWLPHVNASLNALAGCLLVLGFVLIKRRREQAHKWTMLACFGVSVAFLGCYLFYHFNTEIVRKLGPDAAPPVRYAYLGMLLTHIVLAALVPFLSVATIYLGLRDRRPAHRRLAKWTFPIWLYVSVTGVLVYVMLYWIYPIS